MGATAGKAILRAWAAALCCAVAWVAMAAPRAADYARPPEVGALVVSPDNTHAAMLVRAPGGRAALATVDLTKPAAPRVIASYADVDVVEAHWVNDRRLVYVAHEPGPRIYTDKWGTFAVDRDGEDHRMVITGRSDTSAETGSQIRQRLLTRTWRLFGPVHDGSDEVLVARLADTVDRGFVPVSLSRLDTRTGRARPVTDGQPPNADHWLFDASGRLAVVSTDDRPRRGLWWQPAAGEPWQRVREWRAFDEDSLWPLALERDGTLIVSARANRDTAALHTFDLRKAALDAAPLVAVEGHDVDAVRFDHRTGQVVGAPVVAQQRTTVWFDEGLARAQAAVDKALPAGRSNTLLCGHCAGATRFVVHSAGDRQPGEYHVFDVAARSLRPLAATRPWIDEASQGLRSHHRIAARDGLSLPVVVTHPAAVPADTPAPTVMLVHGGPWAPGATLAWEAEPQFLASLGYRVLQVSFRATTGLGWRHFRASWGEFGQAMQDDLEDALRWAVRERLTDPDRVCIYGASYGGYAALMGPVRHPGRYRCAASHVGVTDLSLLFGWTWSDVSSAARRYDLRLLIGDPDRDAEKLRRLSPVHRAAEIGVPLLVASGRLDERVPPAHADRFVAAARRAEVGVERIDYEDGHGFSRPESQADFWNRLARFLARNLAPR
jgi:dienelactone hydrolase